MSNYRGITVNSVIAKLFAMILEQRIAKWADEHGVKAGGKLVFGRITGLLITYMSCEL